MATKARIVVATFASAFALSAVVAMLHGCIVSTSDDDGTAPSFDCQFICERYADCYDDTYDTVACTDRCDVNASESVNFGDRAYACELCLEDHSCSGSFVCQDTCAGIVP